MSYLGNNPSFGTYRKLDSLTFNGVTTSFNLTIGGSAVFPVLPEALIISLNNQILNPRVAYNVSGSTLTFTSAPTNGTPFFGVLLGERVSIANVLPLSGGTLAGPLVLSGDPLVALGSATKQYVDTTTATAAAGTATSTQTLQNKTIALGSNSISGTLAQFNNALTDADFRTTLESIFVMAGSFSVTNGLTYVITAPATITLPASPSPGTWTRIINRSNDATSVVSRNGQNIMGLAEDMTIDSISASIMLIYADATRGWVLN